MKLIRQMKTETQPETLLNFEDYDINQMYLDLLNDFLVAVQRKPNSVATVESGFNCMKVFEMLGSSQ